MSIDNQLFIKAYDLWESFKEEVLYKNRFIVNHEVLDYLKHFAEKNHKTIEKDTILYRARLYTGDETFISYLNSGLYEKGLEANGQPYVPRPASYHPLMSKEFSKFWGYDEKDSFVPSNNDIISDGRANPAFIKYLYTAEEPYTALVEVRPYLGSKVSVAEIRVNEPMIVANFSYESLEKLEGVERKLMFLIMEDFSKPSDSNKKDYIPTQYISEYIKTLGMEGIRFNSSLYGRGRNITIFNYDKCQPIGSKLYEISDICLEAKGIAPLNESDLIHYKLEVQKEKQFQDFLKELKTRQNKKG